MPQKTSGHQRAPGVGGFLFQQSSDPPLISILQTFIAQYKKTPKKLQVLDCFCACSLVTAALQYLYVVAVGSFPFNAFLAGFFCCIGAFVLTMSLRLRVTEETDASDRQAYLGYMLAMTSLFLAVWNYIG